MTSSDTLPLSEDQQALQDTLRGFLAGQLPPATLRAALETRAGYSPELHVRLAREFGLAGLTIPREFGGRGLSQVEACVVHSELGRALYPGPLLATTLAGGMLLATGNRAVQERWLPMLADGSVIATVAAAGEGGHWVFGPDSVRAERAPGGWRLYGHRWYVLAAHAADMVVVPAMTEAGPAMFLADPRSLGCTDFRAAGPGRDAAGLRHRLRRGPGPADRGGGGCGRSSGTGRTGLLDRHRG